MALNFKKEFKERAEREKKYIDGVWRDYEEGSRLRIAPAGNSRYRAFIRKRAREMRNAQRLVRSGQGADMLTLEATAYTILTDWSGIVGDDGKEVKYTPERGVEAFKKFPAFLDDVTDMSAEVGMEDEEEQESQAGN
jgi:hypothetical protein